MPQTLLCGNLFDGINDQLLKNVWVTIEDGLFKTISNNQPAAGDRVSDLSRYTVLPGFIDAHDHVCLDPGNEIAQAQEPSAWLAIRGAARVRSIIEAGVTTLRSPGEHERIDASLKRAINDGLIPGPRMVTSGMWICRTGGSGWWDEKEVDGPWELRKAIREEVKYGADWIKIMVTGDFTTPNSDPTTSDFTSEEIFAAVEEAHRLGKKIGAHAHGGPAVDYLVEAGVDVIEHGFYMTEQQLSEMANKGTFLCSTYGIVGAILNEPQSPDYSLEGCQKYEKIIDQMLSMAIKAKVPIVVGTDGNHGKMAVELDALIRAGYNHSQALKALTSDAARLLEMTEQVGAIKAGLKADLVVIEGDPFEDIFAIENIKLVLKDGNVVISHFSM